MPEALKKADEVLQQAVQGITDLINLPALINLDFADVQTVMTDKGIAHIGIGEAKGDDKALEAVQQAVSSPLLETTIEGASHVIINISGDISLMDANDAASYVQELTGEEANIIFGAMYDDSVADYVFAQEHVDALLLEYDDERSGGFEPLAKVSADKKVVLGLITSKKPELEDKQTVIRRIHEAAKYIPLERLCLSPQCGFASCEVGNKLTEEDQWAKLALVKEIAEEVWGA